MRKTFSGSIFLSVLPEISKWNTSNVNNMGEMLYQYYSLSDFPDISIWNTYNVNDMSGMFFNCLSVSFFPDIFSNLIVVMFMILNVCLINVSIQLIDLL